MEWSQQKELKQSKHIFEPNHVRNMKKLWSIFTVFHRDSEKNSQIAVRLLANPKDI